MLTPKDRWALRTSVRLTRPNGSMALAGHGRKGTGSRAGRRDRDESGIMTHFLERGAASDLDQNYGRFARRAT